MHSKCDTIGVQKPFRSNQESGEVDLFLKKPGRFELRSGSTVLDFLAMAEGVNEFASPSRIVILRNEGGVTRRLRFNYNKVTAGNVQENYVLRPGDIIVVP